MVKFGAPQRTSAFAQLALLLTLITAAPAPVHSAATGEGAPTDEALWIEAELQADTLHVQAQARYTLRLWQGVSVRDLAFHAPESALAEIRPAGESIREEARDGRRYRVTERHYAIFPFASGNLPLRGGHVTLRIGGTSSPETRIEAPALTRDVSPVPTDHRADEWLPARAVTLTDSWQPDASQLLPGQPLRRTIRVEAVGVASAQIPPLHIDADGFSVHPEPPRLEERAEDGWITGIREQSWLLVPRHAGDFTLPPLHLPWTDPVSGQPRQATLPARPIAVIASPRTRDLVADPHAAPAAESPSTLPSTPTMPTGGANAAGTGAPLLAAIALLATGAAAMRRRHATATLRRIRRACRNNDPIAARANLLQWSRELGAPGPGALLALARHIGGTATDRELAALDRHLYGKTRQPWNGRPLIAALRSEHPEFHPWRLLRTTSDAKGRHRPPETGMAIAARPMTSRFRTMI